MDGAAFLFPISVFTQDMNKLNDGLMAIDGAMAPLFSLISRSKQGGSVLLNNGQWLQAQSPYEMASVVREGSALVVIGEADSSRWGWGFPGWEAEEARLAAYGFDGVAGIAPSLLSLAGFDQKALKVHIALLTRLGHCGFAALAEEAA
jgi:hypothetical protein